MDDAYILQQGVRIRQEVALKPLTILIAFFVFFFGTQLSAAEYGENSSRTNGSRFPMMIADKMIVDGNMTHRTGVVLDEDGTVYILSVTGASQESLLRVSKKGSVKQLILYRGWPYVLDNHGKIYAFDDSWYGSLSNKFSYMGIRALKTVPVAVGVGLSAYAIGLVDTTFLGFLPTREVPASATILGGMLVFYGADLAYTAFVRSHRDIGHGGNFYKDGCEGREFRFNERGL